MPNINGLDGLKQLYPVFEFRNRTQQQQVIWLDNGDTMLVQPGATGKCKSNMFTQLPELSKFEYITPSTQDLISAGVIATTSESSPVPTMSEVAITTTSQKGGEPLKSKTGSNS